MPWAWGLLTIDSDKPSGPTTSSGRATSTRWRPALLAAGDRAGARPRARLPLQPPAEAGRLVPAEQRRRGRRERWTKIQLDEVALPLVLAWQLGRIEAGHVHATSRRPRTTSSENGPSPPQERWENQSGYSPGTIAAEIAGLVRAADIARAKRRHRLARALGGDRRRVAAPRSRAGPPPQRPLVAEAVLPARDEGRQPQRRHDLQHRRRRPGRADQRTRDRPELPRARAPRREALGRPGIVQRASRWWTSGSAWTRPTGASGTASTSTATARRRDGGPWDLSEPGHLQDDRAGYGRSSPASAASTSCSRGPPADQHLAADGQDRQPGLHDPRAGLGREPALGPSRIPPRRGHALGDARSPGRTRSSCDWPGRSRPAGPSSGRASWRAGTRAADRGRTVAVTVE